MTEAQRKYLFDVNAILKGVVADIGAVDEATFNAAAFVINAKAAAIQTWLPDRDYLRGDLAIDPADGVPYWAMHNHGPSTGQVHRPSESSTIWAHCHGTTPETAREFVAEGHNPYNEGHYCRFGETVKRCNRNNVIHSPMDLPSAWDDVHI